MKNLILTVGMSLFLISAYSQEVDSTITIIKKKQYFQNDQKLTATQLSTILSNNAASASEYKKSNIKTIIGAGCLLAGASIIAVAALIDLSASIKESNDLNNGIYTGDYNNVGLGVYLGGLACVIAAVPLVNSGRKSLHDCAWTMTEAARTERERSSTPTRTRRWW